MCVKGENLSKKLATLRGVNIVSIHTLAHICECKEADERIERKLTDELKQWKKGSELERKVNIKLTGKPVRDLCEYVAEFEKSAKKEKLRN